MSVNGDEQVRDMKQSGNLYPALPFEEMRKHGLLWLINATVFHPRGYALYFGYDENNKLGGWYVMGDGKEPWQYGDNCDSEFAAVEAFLAMVRERGGADVKSHQGE